MTSDPIAPEVPPAMLGMDALAVELIGRAEPFRFTLAQSLVEREMVQQARYRVAAARGWIDAGDFSAGLERDAHDERAVTVVAWDGEDLAGAVRVVLPAVGELLPTEAAFDLRIEPVGKVVDVGRLLVNPGYGDANHRVLLGLLGQTWLVMRTHGFSQTCGILTRSMARLYRSLGLQVIIIGSGRCFWREERYPVLVPSESFQRMAQKSEAVLWRKHEGPRSFPCGD